MITFLYSIEVWLILFFWVGLLVKRKHLGWLPAAALALVFARYVARSTTLLFEIAPGNRPISDFLGQPWLMQTVNILAITALFTETVGGSECWRISRINKRRILLGHLPINLRRKSK